MRTPSSGTAALEMINGTSTSATLGLTSYPTPTEKRIDQVEKDVICPVAACQGRFYFNDTATELRVLDFSSSHEPALSAIAIDDAVAADGATGTTRSTP